MTVDRETEPAEALARLAEVVYAGASYDDVYAALCRTAVEAIPGCDHACVSTLQAGQDLVSHGATDDIAELVDAYQSRTRSGPCFDAIVEQSFQWDPDFTRDPTWPDLAALLLEHTPVRGGIGYRIVVGGRKAGALNIFSDTPGALTAESADIGAILAAFATVSLTAAGEQEKVENLKRGLTSSREIGKAVGILMVTHGLDDAQAFDVLRRASSSLNIRLAEIAQRVVDEHRTGLAAP